MTIRVAIVGAGRGLRFVRFIKQLGTAECAGIFDPAPEARAKATALDPDLTLFDSYEQLLDDAPDGVIVASPQQLHAPQAIDALQRGVAVLSEVPAAIDLEQAMALATQARKASAIYMIGENFCFLPEVVTVRAMVRAGLFGDVYFAEGQYIHRIAETATDTWRREWQVGRDAATYLTHAAGPPLSWLARPLERVSCVGAGSDEQFPSHRNTYVLTGETSAGVVVRLRQDLLSHRPRSTTWFALQGTDGAFESDATEWSGSGRVCIDRDTSAWQSLDDFQRYLPDDFIDEAGSDRRSGDVYMLKLFIDAVRDNLPSPLGIDDALAHCLPGIMSEESVRQGGAWVDIPAV